MAMLKFFLSIALCVAYVGTALASDEQDIRRGILFARLPLVLRHYILELSEASKTCAIFTLNKKVYKNLTLPNSQFNQTWYNALLSLRGKEASDEKYRQHVRNFCSSELSWSAHKVSKIRFKPDYYKMRHTFIEPVLLRTSTINHAIFRPLLSKSVSRCTPKTEQPGALVLKRKRAYADVAVRRSARIAAQQHKK